MMTRKVNWLAHSTHQDQYYTDLDMSRKNNLATVLYLGHINFILDKVSGKESKILLDQCQGGLADFLDRRCVLEI